jgi:hypothetical protein
MHNVNVEAVEQITRAWRLRFGPECMLPGDYGDS